MCKIKNNGIRLKTKKGEPRKPAQPLTIVSPHNNEGLASVRLTGASVAMEVNLIEMAYAQPERAASQSGPSVQLDSSSLQPNVCMFLRSRSVRDGRARPRPARAQMPGAATQNHTTASASRAAHGVGEAVRPRRMVRPSLGSLTCLC